MRVPPATSVPEEVLASLDALVPGFGAGWVESEPQPGDFTLHGLMREFAAYLSAKGRALTSQQAAAVGAWLSQGVAAGGALENAVSTCLLEHLRQLDLAQVLGPHLSRMTKERTHA